MKALAINPSWIGLMHYERSLLGRYVSLVDDERYFFSPQGKANPEAELAATLAALRLPLDENSNQHALCRFPARAAFLATIFADIKRLIEEVECSEFIEWSTAINAKYVTLVFPSAFINNPASTFGHTFLRFDSAEAIPLLSYAANYEAYSDPTDSGLVYAIKGVFGGYHGEFAVVPYYKKIEQYNDLEDRDIWEYRLQLAPEEVAQLVRHLWELRRIQFSYFYFDENCSYQLLSLLEAARPSFEVKQKFSSWVLPIDTVRALLEDESILASVTYRPAKATSLKVREQQAEPRFLRYAKQIALGRMTIEELESKNLSEQDRASVLDLAYEYVNYQILSSASQQDDFRERAHRLLLARSKLSLGDSLVFEMPEIRPDEGHLTSRARIGVGNASGDPFYRIEYRGVYHDLLDPAPGFMPGAAIELGNFNFEHREGESLRLRQLTVINAESLSPRGNFIKPLSWSLSAGLRRLLVEGERPLVVALDAAVGFSWNLDSLLFSALLRLSSLTDNDLSDGYALGAGPKLLLLSELTDNLAMMLHGETIRYGVGDDFLAFTYGAEVRASLSRNQAIRVGLERVDEKNDAETIAKVSFDFFF